MECNDFAMRMTFMTVVIVTLRMTGITFMTVVIVTVSMTGMTMGVIFCHKPQI
jgi:hypothetical protein